MHALYKTSHFYCYDSSVYVTMIVSMVPEIARLASAPYVEQYKQLKAHVDHTIRDSAYSEVNLSRLFDGLFALK